MFILADIASGPAILTIGLVGGGVLFLVVVLIEALALRLLRWAGLAPPSARLPRWRPF